MKELLVWKPKFNTGVEEVDLEHHYFLNLINRLSVELEDSDDKGYQNKLLIELSMYAQFHFLSEENIMYRIGYPELAEHQKLHNHLLQTLHVKNGMMGEGMIKAEEIIDFLTGWFINHTVKEDQKIGVFLSKNAE